jgi:hypothetical protein
MKYNLLNIRFLCAVLASCSLLCVQHAFAQDSSNAGIAKLTVSFLGKDSTRQVMAAITKPDGTGKDTAVKGVEVHFYIYRSFGLLPIEGDNTTTDENGEATADFPSDIPGDKSGNVTVIARVEDDEQLGNIETKKNIQWGIPVNKQQTAQPRALWSSANNAPWLLVITVTGMVGVVWGIIVYIIFQLVAIKRASRYET